MALAFWLRIKELQTCPSFRPLAHYETDNRSLIRCCRRKNHKPPHRSLFGLEW